MNNRYIVSVLLVVLGLLLSSAILVMTLYAYWVTREEWLIPLIMSGFCWLASSLLVGCWTRYVVLPYLGHAIDGTAMSTERSLHVPRERSAGWRWGVGLGMPLVVFFLGIMAVFYFPRGWFGSLFLVV
ncbi:MAG: hypothetical protein HXY34_08600 [Candidatus Thorarchaeota archaeon]|nr:hypothetical protein [Candidatus Thorarchaeota archaeon]